MVQVILQTIVIPQLQSTDKVFDALVGAFVEETVEIPQLHFVEAWTLFLVDVAVLMQR